MQGYTDYQKYIRTKIGKVAEIEVPFYERLQIDPEHPIYNNINKNFSQSYFKYPFLPLYMGDFDIPNVEDCDINVLRLLIKSPNSKSIFLPESLFMFKDFVLNNINYHANFFDTKNEFFCYLTVRVSNYNDLYYKNSMEWHIDGFQGGRIPRHKVEQNIFWMNKSPTQFLLQPMYCEGLNPSKYDINHFFEKEADERFTFNIKEKALYMINPYNIHRVNKKRFSGKRVFIRLNFSPVLIEDNTNTENSKIVYNFKNRVDVRNFLSEYRVDEKPNSGFSKGG